MHPHVKTLKITYVQSSYDTLLIEVKVWPAVLRISIITRMDQGGVMNKSVRRTCKYAL